MANIYHAPIIARRQLSQDTWVLELEQRDIAESARPGNFVMVSPMREQVNYDPITPRPYSLMALLYDSSEKPMGFSLIIKTFGRGSAAICARREGELLTINGPLGNHLDLDSQAPFTMTAGGTGIAPVTFASQMLSKRGVDHTVIYGGRDNSSIFLDELDRYGVYALAATEDGSHGHHGLVTELLEEQLLENGSHHVFSCGPWAMMQACAGLAARYGQLCTCSLERYMACGFGVCLACIYRTTTDEENHTCCQEGPVVNGLEVDWNA